MPLNDVQLEFDDERSGSFAPLKHVPLNKNVVLGLVTSKKPDVCLPIIEYLVADQDAMQLESIDRLKERIYEAAAAMETPSRSKEAALNQ